MRLTVKHLLLAALAIGLVTSCSFFGFGSRRTPITPDSLPLVVIPGLVSVSDSVVYRSRPDSSLYRLVITVQDSAWTLFDLADPSHPTSGTWTRRKDSLRLMAPRTGVAVDSCYTHLTSMFLRDDLHCITSRITMWHESPPNLKWP